MKKTDDKIQKRIGDAILNKVWEWNPETHEIRFGERWKRILGYEDHELPDTSDTWLNHIHSEDREKIQGSYEANLKAGEPFTSLGRFRHKNGTWRTILNQIQCIKDDDGKVIRMVGVHTDITELVETQGRLESFHALAELSPDIVGIANLRGNVLYLNPAAIKLGWTQVEKGKSLFPKHSVEFFDRTIYPALLENGFWEGEVYFTDVTAKEDFPVHQRSFLIKDAQGKPRAIATVARDLREQRKLEAQIERQRAQFLQNSKMTALGEMASGIAHEINNPLAIMLGHIAVIRLQMSSGEKTLPQIEKNLLVLEQTVNRIAQTVQELRSFARDGSKDPHVPIPLEKLLSATLLFCQSRYSNNDIQLKVTKPSQYILLCGQELQLRQAIMNLLSNAFDAVAGLQGEKWIHLDCQVHDEQCVIRISDSGNGISPDNVNRMMEPFFTTKETGRGSGMGLPVAQGIVQAHKGSLFFDKEAPHTTFVITLPISN